MMTNKEILKKKIIYRSMHRGTKEMDLLLGSFVEKNINLFDLRELNDLIALLILEDDILYKWYFENVENNLIPRNKTSQMLKDFKF